MKLFKEKLDLDCRFEIYKQAFPEMNRANIPEFPRCQWHKDSVYITYENRCVKLVDLHPPSVLPPPCQLDKQRQPSNFSSDEELYSGEGELWNCGACEHRSFNWIHRMLISNFCKDKDMRKELLQYYYHSTLTTLSRVIRWPWVEFLVYFTSIRSRLS